MIKMQLHIQVEVQNDDSYSKFSIPVNMRGERYPVVWTEHAERSPFRGASLVLHRHEQAIFEAAKAFCSTLKREEKKEIEAEVKSEGLFTTYIYEEELEDKYTISAEIWYERA